PARPEGAPGEQVQEQPRPHSSDFFTQSLPRLLDDRVVGALFAVQEVDRSGEEMRLPSGADPPGILKHRDEELVVVGIPAGFLAHPAPGRLHELGGTFAGRSLASAKTLREPSSASARSP